MAAASLEDQPNHEECTYTQELKSKTVYEEETATYGSKKKPPSPTKRTFAIMQYCITCSRGKEQREDRKTGLGKLSLLNRYEEWQEGGC